MTAQNSSGQIIWEPAKKSGTFTRKYVDKVGGKILREGEREETKCGKPRNGLKQNSH